MLSTFGHLQINVRPENRDFYRDLMEFMGWREIHNDGTLGGYMSDNNASLWFMSTSGQDTSDFDNLGVNHIGLNVTEQEDVDSVTNYLAARGVDAVFETPRHRSDFAGSDSETYYQVMFRSPDNILFEVVYTGLKK